MSPASAGSHGKPLTENLSTCPSQPIAETKPAARLRGAALIYRRSAPVPRVACVAPGEFDTALQGTTFKCHHTAASKVKVDLVIKYGKNLEIGISMGMLQGSG